MAEEWETKLFLSKILKNVFHPPWGFDISNLNHLILDPACLELVMSAAHTFGAC